MKILVIPFFSCLLVLTLLLGSFSSAKAEIGDDPVVTPASGDMEFTTEVVPIASLPGTIELADLMLAPAGFPVGEAQFEGAGVLVTKFDAGKATACFTISGTQWGWGGKVGMWDGNKWVLLPSTITKAEEALNSLACASVTGNGTYAFIKYVTEPDKLPTYGACTDNPQIEMLLMVPGEGPYFELYIAILIHTPVPAMGASVSYQVIDSDPAGLIVSGGSGAGIVAITEPSDGIIGIVAPGLFEDPAFPLQIGFNPEAPYFNYVTVRISFPDCYFDYQFTEDNLGGFIFD